MINQLIATIIGRLVISSRYLYCISSSDLQTAECNRAVQTQRQKQTITDYDILVIMMYTWWAIHFNECNKKNQHNFRRYLTQNLWLIYQPCFTEWPPGVLVCVDWLHVLSTSLWIYLTCMHTSNLAHFQSYSSYWYKPLMWGVFQQGALRTGGNVGQFSKPVSAGGAAELLVRHSCSNLE